MAIDTGDEEWVQLTTPRLWLNEVLPREAAALAASPPSSRPQHWAEGFPLEGTRGGAGMLAKAHRAGMTRPGFGMYLIVVRSDARTVGDLGFFGPPDPGGTVEIGYGIVESYRGRGLVSEAVAALCAWTWGHPEVGLIRARTAADNPASHGVLRRVGFVDAGTEDTLRLHHLRRAPG